MLLLQEFDFNIQHRPGVEHVVADYLSHLETGEQPDQEYGDFPDATLFFINNTEMESYPRTPRSRKWRIFSPRAFLRTTFR